MGDLNFGRNMSCRKCGGAKQTPLNEHNLNVAEKGAAGYASRAGDWICPNCHEIQFAKNSACKKCGMNKPPPEQIQTVSNGAYNAKAGDWVCPQSSDIQFAKNIQCRKCGAPNPVLSSVGLPNGIPSLTDWICPQCSDVQFARNEHCRKCGAPNPSLPPSGMPLEIPAQLQAFVNQWNLDTGSVVTLLQLDQDTQWRVLVEFAPKKHTTDVNKLFRGFVRSIATSGPRSR